MFQNLILMMRAVSLSLLLIAVHFVPAAVLAREWVDSTGKFRLKAELVAVRSGKVILEREDGSILSLSISRLSKGDQKYLKAEQQPGAIPKTIPKPPAASVPKPGSKADNTGKHAISILKKHCFRCHGEDGSDEGFVRRDLSPELAGLDGNEVIRFRARDFQYIAIPIEVCGHQIASLQRLNRKVASLSFSDPGFVGTFRMRF